MRTRGRIPPRTLARAIEMARSLVEGHGDPAVPPAQRLRDIAKKLNVGRIEGGARDVNGFLAEEADGTFAVYYRASDMPARRRFTIAHELAHLILDKYHKHLATNQAQARLASRGSRARKSQLAPRTNELEWYVDRIAAELLMPEPLLVPLIRDHCLAGRESSPTGVIDKHKVLRDVAKAVGASEWALARRLMELTGILAVRLEFHWREQGLFGRLDTAVERLGIEASRGLQIQSYPHPTRSNLEGKDGWVLPVGVRVFRGQRTIQCQGWRRPPPEGHPAVNATWVVGWTWNTSPIPEWDDSEG